MKVFIIIATLVVCSCAAPTVELQHPSTVNPSVSIEEKPKEKIVPITDPKEVEKLETETKQPIYYPTVLPEVPIHHITKRDHKPGHETKPVIKPKAPQPPQKPASHPQTSIKKPIQKHQPQPQPQPPTKPSTNKRHRRDTETHQKPQTLPALNFENVSTEKYQKPQTLPAILPATLEHAAKQNKRDIPVPLVPKYQHPEESPKDDIKENDHDEKHSDLETQPAHNVEIQKPQTLPALLKESSDPAQPQKRNIPEPLVPQHQHSAESPKDNNAKKSNEEQAVNAEKHHDVQTHHISQTFQKPQILPAHNHEHIVPTGLQKPQVLPSHNEHLNTEGFQKPQTLPAILKETTESDQQQQSHDISKKSSKSNIENHPNVDEVQVEDLSEPNHKPNIANDHLSTDSTTTDLPIIRRKPVPVAELFARPHNN